MTKALKEGIKDLLHYSNQQEMAVALYLEKEIRNGNSPLETALLESKKAVKDCFTYLTQQAKKMARNQQSVMVQDATVYQWVSEYYLNGEWKKQKKEEKKTTAQALAKPVTTSSDMLAHIQQKQAEDAQRNAERQKIIDDLKMIVGLPRGTYAEKFATFLKKEGKSVKDYEDFIKEVFITGKSPVEIAESSGMTNETKENVKEILGDKPYVLSKKDRKEVMKHDEITLF